MVSETAAAVRTRDIRSDEETAGGQAVKRRTDSADEDADEDTAMTEEVSDRKQFLPPRDSPSSISSMKKSMLTPR